MKRQIRYSPCSIVCHGLCEVRIAEFLRSKFRLGIREFSNNSGKNSLEVQNLPQQLCRLPGLQNKSAFCKTYNLNKSEFQQFLSHHRIFCLMDKDAADEKTWQQYKDGTLFHGLWLEPYIVPIYFEPDFDVLSERAGYPIDKKRHKPDQVQKYLNDPRRDYLQDLASNTKLTNLQLLLDYLSSCGHSF